MINPNESEDMNRQVTTDEVLGRPDWDTWFMTLCFVIAQRSIDPATKHGTVMVSDDKTILAMIWVNKA